MFCRMSSGKWLLDSGRTGHQASQAEVTAACGGAKKPHLFCLRGSPAPPLLRNKQGCAFGFREQSTGLFHTLILLPQAHAAMCYMQREKCKARTLVWAQSRDQGPPGAFLLGVPVSQGKDRAQRLRLPPPSIPPRKAAHGPPSGLR